MTMEPLTKTYRGIELTFTLKRHDRDRVKMWVEFDCLGTKYRNGQLLSVAATDAQKDAAVGSLELWAHQVINDHVSE